MKVLVPFSPDELDDVPGGFEVVYADAIEQWPASVADAEFYVPTYRFTPQVFEVMAQLPALTTVQLLTAGYEHVLPHLRDGVTLCNGAGIHDAATSELAVGLMISAQRRLAELARLQAEHRWDQQMSSSLADRRVLVIGAGNIGRALQRRLVGFECDVTLVGRSPRDGVRGIGELPDLLPSAEIVVLIVPLTPGTTGLVDARFLSLLPDGALVVNVARGAVVATEDLVAEVASGRLRAALDVTEPEPLPADHPLWTIPGVTITPHVGGAATSMWPRAHRLVGDQLRRLAAGQPLGHVVVPGAGAK
ncbi:MAG: 2-hydroxyacid dehydrogenase [Nocardioidaceae bacterium]|nr:2-hydroxyacid dehydrogenase [Nocardioidaceae bacterium]